MKSSLSFITSFVVALASIIAWHHFKLTKISTPTETSTYSNHIGQVVEQAKKSNQKVYSYHYTTSQPPAPISAP